MTTPTFKLPELPEHTEDIEDFILRIRLPSFCVTAVRGSMKAYAEKYAKAYALKVREEAIEECAVLMDKAGAGAMTRQSKGILAMSAHAIRQLKEGK